MAKRKHRFVMSLDVKSISDTAKWLKDYSNRLEHANRVFLSRCAEVGIRASRRALAHNAEFRNYITFEQQMTDIDGGSRMVIIAIGEDKIVKWRRYNDIVEAPVNGLLMEEFGSGNMARNPFNVEGVGQGSFPGQTHAFDDEWHWMDVDGNWHTSSGYEPSMPMYNASVTLHEQVVKIAREVFREL